MSATDHPTTFLEQELTTSPEPQSTTFSVSRSSSLSSASSGVTLSSDAIVPGEGEEKVPSSPRPVRFRSASLALDAAVTSFNQYRKGKYRRGKEDRGLTLNTEMEYIATMTSPLTSGLEGSGARLAQCGTNTFVEGLPELLKVLQDVAAIHPFIQLAVGAFKVAIELDLKRRENDKKIGLMFLEMRDMMTALVELQNVVDGHVGKDGKTIQERLKNLVDLMEEDIKECANACDAYAKKKMLSKVLQGYRWDDALQVFIQRFNKRRADIEFALAIHLGVNIDVAHRKLDMLDYKVDRIIALLRQSVSPEERELSSLIERRGGTAAVLGNEQLLASLYRERSSPTPTVKIPQRQSTTDFQALKADVLDDPDIAIANNMETFERKFRMQQRELADEMRRIVHHAGDLVVNAVTAGPHDRIIDPDLRNIWKEMRWRGNVKARHFVLALRDYCLEKLDKIKKNGTTFGACEYDTQVTQEDEWALEYINVTRLQAIIEAFDDDASGFITVAEANTFTTSRPANWSLLHWMAYWAVGWQMAMTQYIVEIDELLEKMFAIKSLILPANRRFVERYLDSVWSYVTELTSGFRRAEWTPVLREKFNSHIIQQEQDIRERLETVRYDIDAPDTLLLVVGPGRIEKHLFLLLYLLLKRDFEIFRIARTTVLHKDELWDSADTLERVFRAVHVRHNDLENLFKQQNYDPNQQFKIFAFEMFNYWHDSSPLWSFERLRESRWIELAYNDAEEDHTINPADILNHPVENTEDPLTIPEYVESPEDRQAQGALHVILGHWCGFIGNEVLSPCEPMVLFDLHAGTSKSNQFIASGSIPSGTRWKLVGDVRKDSKGSTDYAFTVTYAARLWPRRFWGTLDDDGRVFSGKWKCNSNNDRGTFFLKRLSCEAMRFWPRPVELQRNKPRALWTFALSAVRDQVRRRLFARSFIEERQKTRQRYLQIIRSGEIRRDDGVDVWETAMHCYRNMTPSEARFYCMVHEYRQRLAPKHYGVACSHCRTTISGARYICLDCHAPRRTVDVCEKPECMSAIIGPDRRADLASPHFPSHRLLKLRRVIHRHREFGGTYRAAHDALIRAEEALSDAHAVQSWEPGEDVQQYGEFQKGCAKASRGLSCMACHAPVARPCWYCIECEDDTFLCSSCEAGNTNMKGKHKATHGLVLCQQPREEGHSELGHPAVLHSRMEALETRMDALQRGSALRFDALDGKVDELRQTIGGKGALTLTTSAEAVLRERMGALDGRMQKIEDLLSALLRRLDSAA